MGVLLRQVPGTGLTPYFKHSTEVRTGPIGGSISEEIESEGKEHTGHKGDAGGSWGRMLQWEVSK